ncbi:MAG: sensor histidine kinase [Erysipelotrichaceae bacterium]
MTKRIFRSFLLLATLVLIFASVITSSFIYGYFQNNEEKNMREILNVVAYNIEKGDNDFLKEFYSTQYRFTLINKEGEVIYDTQFDSDQLENHLDRAEIVDAFNKGYGISERYSKTMMQKTMYQALLLNNGDVIRISISHISIIALLLTMMPYILIVVVLSVMVASILANRMSIDIVKPLVNLNLDNPIENDTYVELSPILKKLNAQHQQIKDQLAQLQRKSEEFAQIISSMNEGLILLNKKGIIISINDAAKRIFNVEGQIEGKDLLVLNRNFEVEKAVNTALAGNRSEIKNEQDGRIYQYIFNGIKSEDQVIGVIIICFDITVIENAQRNRQEFTANFSHELKTPLQSIIGSAELLENGLVRQEDQNTFYQNIKKESQRLLELINNIILLSKLDTKVDDESVEVDLYLVCQEVMGNLQVLADNKNVSLSLIGESEVIKTNRECVYQIVFNLCENAIIYNNENGKVVIEIKRENGKVMLSVTDDGIGIPANQQNRIFERFYRVDKSHSKKTGGTGLGLSIVKHAADNISATVKVNSVEGKGSSFTVTF